MYKILVVEDDISLRSQLVDTLRVNGYEVFYVEDFHTVVEQVDRLQPDLIVLDINLPYMDGNYFCRAIRKKHNMPIIFTSARNSESDQILSMELGGDDYVVKPFNVQVLMSKISASLRRCYGEYNSGSSGGRDITVKGITLDDLGMKLSYKGESYELSKNEYKLLKIFMQNPDEVISRETLLGEIWDDKSFVDDNTLTVNMTRLKKIFESMGLENSIKTKRGMGYIFSTGEIDE
ncbi:MAG: response regulator transcription factor [Eubacteriales bacterium]|nr:response regulator transcription factor [Eubacteriales bacterium]